MQNKYGLSKGLKVRIPTKTSEQLKSKKHILTELFKNCNADGKEIVIYGKTPTLELKTQKILMKY